MKKIPAFSFLVLLIVSVVLFSCSKESPGIKDQNTSTAIIKNNAASNTSSRLAPKHYGFISGVLVPAPAKAMITAFNDDYSFEVSAEADGSFLLNDVMPGGYNVKIDYVPVGGNDYFSMTIPKVVVSPGTVTNLGNISLY